MKFVAKELRETADASRGGHTLRDHLSTIALWVGLMIAGYFLLGLIADLIATHVPDRFEAKLFSISENMSDVKPDARLQQIFKRLTQSEPLRDLPFTLRVLETKEANAFAVPGGLVVVTTGLVEQVKGEIGLALVLGHELGHHQQRHVLKRMGRLLLITLAKALLFGSSDSTPLSSASYELALATYSRQQEYDADEFGLRLVNKAYGKTAGATEFFEWALKAKPDNPWIVWFASHPLTESRRNRLATLSAKLVQGPKK